MWVNQRFLLVLVAVHALEFPSETEDDDGDEADVSPASNYVNRARHRQG
ncbi:MAG TPA: hypothetical protein VK327_06725 [Candidatus Paceibacterota bacterium]|nr:hypothetical protein [Candidatus Paceibacterota bacterium]